MECCLECDLDMAAAVLEDESPQPYYLEHYNNSNNNSNTANNEEDLDMSAETAAGEDCCLCLESMHPSDLVLPMLCPLAGCQFNYCTQCVWNLLLTSSQPYQEASDGSNQLKIPLQCPQCRTRYPHRQIVQDVLLLRQACRLQKYFISTGTGSSAATVNESTLKASELATKQAFVEQVTWEALKESWIRVDKYIRDHGKMDMLPTTTTATATATANNNTSPTAMASSFDNSCSAPSIPKLPTQWKHILMHQPSARNSTVDSNGLPKPEGERAGGGQAQYTLVDPTLFRGMEESMTLDEQQFLSELLVSGSVPNLTQAAQILYGMLQVMQNGGPNANNRNKPSNIAASFSNLSETTGSKYTRAKKKKTFRLLTTGTHLLYPDMDLALLKKRFPLPSQMPRWIVLPLYHPDKRGVPLKLKDHKWGLEIVGVKGAAGQQGLRRGDVVTHVNEESIETCSVSEFHQYLRTLFELNATAATAAASSSSTSHSPQQPHHHHHTFTTTLSLVVNAHPEAAQALQQRSFEMIHFLIQRQKEREAQQRITAPTINRTATSNTATTAASMDGQQQANSSSNHQRGIGNSHSSGAAADAAGGISSSGSSDNSHDGEQYVIRNQSLNSQGNASVSANGGRRRH